MVASQCASGCLTPNMHSSFLLVFTFLLSSSTLFQIAWSSNPYQGHCNVNDERRVNRQSSYLQTYPPQISNSGYSPCYHSPDFQESNRHEESTEGKSDFYKETGYELEVPEEAAVVKEEEIVDYQRPELVEDNNTFRQDCFSSNTNLNQPNNYPLNETKHKPEIFSDQNNYQCKILDTPYSRVPFYRDFKFIWPNQAIIPTFPCQSRNEFHIKCNHNHRENIDNEQCPPLFEAPKLQIHQQTADFPIHTNSYEKPVAPENQHNIFDCYQNEQLKVVGTEETSNNDCPVLKEEQNWVPPHSSQYLPGNYPQEFVLTKPKNANTENVYQIDNQYEINSNYYNQEKTLQTEYCPPEVSYNKLQIQQDVQTLECPKSSYSQEPVLYENQRTFNYYQNPQNKIDETVIKFDKHCPVLQEEQNWSLSPIHLTNKCPQEIILNWQNQAKDRPFHQNLPQINKQDETVVINFQQEAALPTEYCPPEVTNNQFQSQQEHLCPVIEPVTNMFYNNQHLKCQELEQFADKNCPVPYDDAKQNLQTNVHQQKVPLTGDYRADSQIYPQKQYQQQDECFVNINHGQIEKCPSYEHPYQFQQHIQEPLQNRYRQEMPTNVVNQQHIVYNYQNQLPKNNVAYEYVPPVSGQKNELCPYTPEIYNQNSLYNEQDTQRVIQNQQLHKKNEGFINISEQQIGNIEENCLLPINHEYYNPGRPLEATSKVKETSNVYESNQKEHLQENQQNYIFSNTQWEQMMEELSQVKNYQKEILESCLKPRDQSVWSPCRSCQTSRNTNFH